MTGLGQAPASLLLIGAASATAAGLILVMLLWHLVRRILDRPRVPLAAGSYVFLVVVFVLLGGTGALAFSVGAALADWPPLVPGSAVAEATCRKLAQGRLQLSFAPLEPDGRSGPEEASKLDGMQCDLTGQILTFRGPLAGLGLGQRHRIVRLGGQIRPHAVPFWRSLPRPFAVPITHVRTDEVSLPPADRTRYRLFVKPDGYWWEKRTD